MELDSSGKEAEMKLTNNKLIEISSKLQNEHTLYFQYF